MAPKVAPGGRPDPQAYRYPGIHPTGTGDPAREAPRWIPFPPLRSPGMTLEHPLSSGGGCGERRHGAIKRAGIKTPWPSHQHPPTAPIPSPERRLRARSTRLLGDDTVEATIVGAVTISGNGGDDDIEVTGDAGILIYGNADADSHRRHDGRHGDDLRRLGDRRSGRRRRQHRRRRRGRLPDLRQRPGRRHRARSSHDEGSDTVFGGDGNDSIFYVRDGNDDSEVLIFGGEQQDVIDVDTSGSVTVFGGVTTVDPADGDDIIEVDGDNGINEVLVYGNGGEDDIDGRRQRRRDDLRRLRRGHRRRRRPTAASSSTAARATTRSTPRRRRRRHGVRRRDHRRPERRRRQHRGHERRRRADLRQRRQRHDRRRPRQTTSTATSRSTAGRATTPSSASADGDVLVYGGEGDDTVSTSPANGSVTIFGGARRRSIPPTATT